MKIKDQVKEIVLNGLPEFYRDEGLETFIKTGVFLIEKGLTLDEVQTILTDLCEAITNEYE